MHPVPRLISQLYEESIFISIGHRDFQIPRELFSDPGNSPNYFSLGFAVFFSTPSEVFPGLDREGLLRPPSILPPSVPNRSADTFNEILHLLRGYPLHIRDEDHRAELLRDCRYFHLKGLEQKLIRHQISFNQSRRKHEIAIRLEDVRQSGISIVCEPSSSSSSTSSSPSSTSQASSGPIGWVNYARPFVDEKPHELVLEIGDEASHLHLSTMRAEFFGDAKTRISRLLEVIATKLNLSTSQPLGLLMKSGGGATSAPASPGNSALSEDHIRVVLDTDAYVLLDGKEWRRRRESDAVEDPDQQPMKKRQRVNDDVDVDDDDAGSWIIRTGQWRLRVQMARSRGRPPHPPPPPGVECVLVAVKLDALSGERARNARRMFLAGDIFRCT